jgi:GAF domain-containing protein
MSERMAAAARELQDQHDPESTMKIAVALLVQNVEGCEAAGVSLVHGKRRIDTPAASDDLVVIGNQLQSEVGEGPCLDAIWEHETVYVPDLATDSRWPRWGPRLVDATGMRSVLSFRLFTTQDTLGALSMYASRTDGFSASDMTEGLALAAHIAIAVAAAQRIEQLEAALDSRTVIAQACGMLMERFDMDAVRAFALLTRLSSSQNVKVRDVAARLVLTRRIPGHDEVPSGPLA